MLPRLRSSGLRLGVTYHPQDSACVSSSAPPGIEGSAPWAMAPNSSCLLAGVWEHLDPI